MCSTRRQLMRPLMSNVGVSTLTTALHSSLKRKLKVSTWRAMASFYSFKPALDSIDLRCANVMECVPHSWITSRSVLGAMSGEKQGNIGPRLRPDIQRLCGYDLFGPNLGKKWHDRIRRWEDSLALTSSREYHLLAMI